MTDDEFEWDDAKAASNYVDHGVTFDMARGVFRDPDAQPVTPENMKHMRRMPQVRVIRRALKLSQEEFADRFEIPLGTLRDWEQGRKDPDAAARAYLVVIGRNPAAVTEALHPAL
jgi:putative transcriptional regulator